MDQDTTTPTGFGAATARDTGTTGVCERCGQPLGQNRSIEQFLAKIGISEEMVNNLKNQMQNVDVEEYLNTAREYLKTAGDKVRTTGQKAKAYSKENPGKVAAGIAILAVGTGLLINALREK